jgi:phosphoserine phosphatase
MPASERTHYIGTIVTELAEFNSKKDLTNMDVSMRSVVQAVNGFYLSVAEEVIDEATEVPHRAAEALRELRILMMGGL